MIFSQLCVLKASKSWFTLWDIIWLHGISFILFFSSTAFMLVFSAPSSHNLFLTCYAHHIIFLSPFLPFGAIKFSFHSLCHLVMAYELCIFFPSAIFFSARLFQTAIPVTGFPSLLPPPSFDQRKSDKIRLPGTLRFVLFFFFTPVCLSLLCPVCLLLI